MYDVLLMIAGGIVALGGVSILGLLAIITYEARQERRESGRPAAASVKTAPARS